MIFLVAVQQKCGMEHILRFKMKIGFHKGISFIKSSIRIISSVLAVSTSSVLVLAIGYGVAEALGVIEELFENN